jgi:LemA protein
MSSQLVVIGALAAVLIFWMVGAHNRVTALRNALHAAWPPLDELLVQRDQALAQLAQAMPEQADAESSPAPALLAALSQVRSAAAMVRQRPSDRDAAAGLGAAEAALAPALDRAHAWLDSGAAEATPPEAGPPRAALELLAPRLALARQAFNQAAGRYNDAVSQFPTSLLAPMLRMRRAGQL